MEELKNSEKESSIQLSNEKENILKENNEKNEINIKLKISKRDIYKNIYFLDNINYIDNTTGKKIFHCNLSELNESNVDLIINNEK